jgi:hypothetical protein
VKDRKFVANTPTRIDSGDGWRPMEDRGSITQNHCDHVHVSFEPSAP